MAKPKKEVKVPTKEESIKTAINWLDADPKVQPKPTRTFEVGEEVVFGNLTNVVIDQILYDGLAYVFTATRTNRDYPEGKQEYHAAWWFSLKKLVSNKNTDVPCLMSQYRVFPAIASDIESILHHMQGGGLVIDPEYQRGYVWTEENKDALIESIFERLDIGAFLFVRHHGYLHAGDESIRTYRTMDGHTIQIKASEDYTISIIDGQQRLTTIIDFILDRRPYKGIYFSQLNGRDQHEFMNKSTVSRIVNEEDTNRKEILRMFLQSNRGVPQSPEHIAKVQAMYDAM